MKTEMKMLPNGNYENVISPIQHECRSHDYSWSCKEYGWKLGILELRISDGDPYENGYENVVEVKFCPFCGYQPDSSKREDLLNSLIVSQKKIWDSVEIDKVFTENDLESHRMRYSEHDGNIVREVQ